MLFISSYELFSFSRYLRFCLKFLVMKEKRLDLKDKVNFKIYNVTTWLKTIAIHILPNISRSKGNQAMKLGQLIEYNKKIIVLQE